MAFGKPGRPPEDRLARQREIFEAVAPLILEVGPRGLAMRDAAQAACLSVGGLYHYFPTKRDLVLFPFQPDAVERCCRDFLSRFGHLDHLDRQKFVAAYFEYMEHQVFRYYRPAIHAALEFGGETFWAILDRSLMVSLDVFVEDLRHVASGISEESFYPLARALRRTMCAALLDTSVTPEEFRAEVSALIEGYGVGEALMREVKVANSVR